MCGVALNTGVDPLCAYCEQWWADNPPPFVAEQLQAEDDGSDFFRGCIIGLGSSLCLWMMGMGVWLVAQ
jgi:hypothetical protein